MGEAEALCLCIENNAQLRLIDDRDARLIARINDIPVSGTLGVLIKAKKMGSMGLLMIWDYPGLGKAGVPHRVMVLRIFCSIVMRASFFYTCFHSRNERQSILSRQRSRRHRMEA